MIHRQVWRTSLSTKWFEDEDGNALQNSPAPVQARRLHEPHHDGVSLSCTDRFEENLEILLKFVFTPYFTDETWRRNAALSIRRSAW